MVMDGEIGNVARLNYTSVFNRLYTVLGFASTDAECIRKCIRLILGEVEGHQG